MTRIIVDVTTGVSTIDANYAKPDFNPILTLEEKRQTTVLDKADFLRAVYNAGILTASDITLASNGRWPTSFDSFLSNMSEAERVEAQIEWGSSTTVRRNHSIIESLIAAEFVTAAQADAVFGI